MGILELIARVLFLCSQNRLRSPTAEMVFAEWLGVECTSAGTNRGADTPISGRATVPEGCFRNFSRIRWRHAGGLLSHTLVTWSSRGQSLRGQMSAGAQLAEAEL